MLHGGGPEEIELTGGGTTRVVRVGQTVRRPAKPWSPAIRELIRQLRTAGVAAVPAWHGIDEQGRDVFDFIPGDVGHYPLPAHVRSDRALVTAARLLRQLHDASVSLLDGRARPWQFPPMEPVEVICHGDFAPYNCIFRNGEAVGVFDFDVARPGPRRWDLGYALYRFAPLTSPTNGDGFGGPVGQGRRARLFLDAYGCSPGQRREALETVVPRLRDLISFMHSAADRGDPNFARHIEDGHDRLYLTDIAYVEAQLPKWTPILV